MSAADKKTIKADSDSPSDSLPPARITGSWFFPEMRMICNLFDLTKRQYSVTECDVFTAEGQKQYELVNAARSMPLVIVNKTNLMADPPTLAKYLCQYYSMESLYPSQSQSIERLRIDTMLEVVYLQFRKATDRLTKFEI